MVICPSPHAFGPQVFDIKEMTWKTIPVREHTAPRSSPGNRVGSGPAKGHSSRDAVTANAFLDEIESYQYGDKPASLQGWSNPVLGSATDYKILNIDNWENVQSSTTLLDARQLR